MITADGYSKDPNIVPEGIAVTFGKEVIDKNGGLKRFITIISDQLKGDHSCVGWKVTGKPKHESELLYVYIILSGRLYARTFFGGMDDDRVVLAGPIVRCPFKRKISGFRNFRYTTKLF